VRDPRQPFRGTPDSRKATISAVAPGTDSRGGGASIRAGRRRHCRNRSSWSRRPDARRRAEAHHRGDSRASQARPPSRRTVASPATVVRDSRPEPQWRRGDDPIRGVVLRRVAPCGNTPAGASATRSRLVLPLQRHRCASNLGSSSAGYRSVGFSAIAVMATSATNSWPRRSRQAGLPGVAWFFADSTRSEPCMHSAVNQRERAPLQRSRRDR
jgi:hypothetical protein